MSKSRKNDVMKCYWCDYNIVLPKDTIKNQTDGECPKCKEKYYFHDVVIEGENVNLLDWCNIREGDKEFVEV